ncbi:hypothetical protein K439DRAFT_307415 [Ramaria rubella]|nr:hypothetical protein K439DRAFT_307415 [Ramaria rubella]
MCCLGDLGASFPHVAMLPVVVHFSKQTVLTVILLRVRHKWHVAIILLYSLRYPCMGSSLTRLRTLLGIYISLDI